MAVSIARYQFSLDEYEKMIEGNVFREGARVELIRGEIVKMAPIGLRHEACVRRLDLVFHELLGRRAIVSVQMSIRLRDDSQPEPDVAVLKWRDDYYANQRATPEDVLLLVEVAESSLLFDRNVKVPLYAESGIADVWLVNLQADVVEVYSNPLESAYQIGRHAGRGETLPLPVALGGSVAVDDMLG